MEKTSLELDLPGFRFHPTEEELLDFYLRRMVNGKKLKYEIIGTINLYRHDPWELPGLAKIGDKEWYFFVPRDRKQANGGRPNRTTDRGFWKATGSDRPNRSAADPKRLIGLKKTLVYYQGRAPRGAKTDWVMNEYRLPDEGSSSASGPAHPKEDIVLCKVYRKATTMKELEQRAAIEEANNTRVSQYMTSMMVSASSENVKGWAAIVGEDLTNTTAHTKDEVRREMQSSPSALGESIGLPEIEAPKPNNAEWSQDTFLSQLRSPWMDQWSPYAHVAPFLNNT